MVFLPLSCRCTQEMAVLETAAFSDQTALQTCGPGGSKGGRVRILSGWFLRRHSSAEGFQVPVDGRECGGSIEYLDYAPFVEELL